MLLLRVSKPSLTESGTGPILSFHDLNLRLIRERGSRQYRGIGHGLSSARVTEWLCHESQLGSARQMQTINKEEPVARSHFIDCPTCNTRSLKLKRVVQVGRCKTCHESYKIVIVYVKEGKKPKPATKPATASTVSSSESTLPSWQVPSDSSLFGSSTTDTSTIFSDLGSSFSQEAPRETSTGDEQ